MMRARMLVALINRINNAILAAAYGLIWSGARSFEGKPVSIVPTLAGQEPQARDRNAKHRNV
jgi:hypothetical protein